MRQAHCHAKLFAEGPIMAGQLVCESCFQPLEEHHYAGPNDSGYCMSLDYLRFEPKFNTPNDSTNPFATTPCKNCGKQAHRHFSAPKNLQNAVESERNYCKATNDDLPVDICWGPGTVCTFNLPDIFVGSKARRMSLYAGFGLILMIFLSLTVPLLLRQNSPSQNTIGGILIFLLPAIIMLNVFVRWQNWKNAKHDIRIFLEEESARSSARPSSSARFLTSNQITAPANQNILTVPLLRTPAHTHFEANIPPSALPGHLFEVRVPDGYQQAGQMVRFTVPHNHIGLGTMQIPLPSTQLSIQYGMGH
mmetsp:Transcript_76047/g.123524  ORF Transcript_76047/g.123524 Transcript_76047/m.123524 type:complete len:306 (-) Transcript_76047:883-1800(-)